MCYLNNRQKPFITSGSKLQGAEQPSKRMRPDHPMKVQHVTKPYIHSRSSCISVLQGATQSWAVALQGPGIRLFCSTARASTNTHLSPLPWSHRPLHALEISLVPLDICAQRKRHVRRHAFFFVSSWSGVTGQISNTTASAASARAATMRIVPESQS